MTPIARLALPLLAAALLAGCSTKRTLTIDSTPPGAAVWVDGERKGTTPVQVPFVHYGTFEVRLEKNGYEALAEEVTVPTKIETPKAITMMTKSRKRVRIASHRGITAA